MKLAFVVTALGGTVFAGSRITPHASLSAQNAAPTCAPAATTTRFPLGDLDSAGRLRHDTSKPVPSRGEILRAWRRRQDAIASFQFEWVENECRGPGWMPNPRYPEREWLAIPSLFAERRYSVTKSLAVDGAKMRYRFDLDRGAEPDGVEIKSAAGDDHGLGVRRHFSYSSVFDGERGETRISSLTVDPPAATWRGPSNPDAQNLDTRAILLAFRPLDAVMGDLLVERAVTNERRAFYRGRSTFLFEERHDPSGWKTILWLEPERDFIVSRFAMAFEQRLVVDVDIDYRQDSKWGWVPSGWRVTEMFADGSKRLVSAATVSQSSINVPVAIERLR